MKVRFAITTIVLAALTSCASLPANSDDMCGPLVDFARSVGPNDVRSIAFHTSWGGNFRDDPEPVIFSKRCIHGDYKPAQAVCAYLIGHGAAEFSGNNAERAISCLAPQTHFGPDVDLNGGEFSIGFGTPEQGSHITIQFAPDATLGGMVLRIVADGY